jgi:endogenous inhibitor of DNA gyrase (YacG/DUF329 family)
MVASVTTVFAFFAAVLLFTYTYYLIQTLLMIVKCPDCGRIMQKVLYRGDAGHSQARLTYECHFCQEKRIRPADHRKYPLFP